jgi:hormone-sensitive lipase
LINAEQVFGLTYKKVILAGDSAGGSLVTSITVMAINRGFRVPDAVLTSYPTTIASPCNFWPSLLSALDDPVLSVSFLNMMAKAYTPGEDRFLGCRSQYMSPGLCTPDSVI